MDMDKIKQTHKAKLRDRSQAINLLKIEKKPHGYVQDYLTNHKKYFFLENQTNKKNQNIAQSLVLIRV